jgi:hypothetical protein
MCIILLKVIIFAKINAHYELKKNNTSTKTGQNYG